MFGLRLRACGENPEAVARWVRVCRWSALGIESILVGMAGSYLALALSSGFAENMTAGRGFIALSIVIFGRWKIKGALLGTAVFGIAAAAQYALQASGIGLPFHLLLAVPYVVTLLILCGITGGTWKGLTAMRGAEHCLADVAEIEWLADDRDDDLWIDAFALDRLHSGRRDNDGNARPLRHDVIDDIVAVGAGQHQIEKNRVVRARTNGGDCFLAVCD